MHFLESIIQLSYFCCCVHYRKPIVKETLHIFLHGCFSVQRELKKIKTFSLISPLQRVLGKSDQQKTCIIDFFYIPTCEETYSISPFKGRIPDSHYLVAGKGGSCIFPYYSPVLTLHMLLASGNLVRRHIIKEQKNQKTFIITKIMSI